MTLTNIKMNALDNAELEAAVMSSSARHIYWFDEDAAFDLVTGWPMLEDEEFYPLLFVGGPAVVFGCRLLCTSEGWTLEFIADLPTVEFADGLSMEDHSSTFRTHDARWFEDDDGCLVIEAASVVGPLRNEGALGAYDQAIGSLGDLRMLLLEQLEEAVSTDTGFDDTLVQRIAGELPSRERLLETTVSQFQGNDALAVQQFLELLASSDPRTVH